MMLVMSSNLPTREQLKDLLDTLYSSVLEEGERRRAERTPGLPPDWTPCPQDNSRYDGLKFEEWDSVPTEPQLQADEWQNAIMLNQIDSVEPLVDAAMRRLGLQSAPGGSEWRLFLRLALVVVADAYQLDADREQGDYSKGFPSACSVGTAQVPTLDPRQGVMESAVRGGSATSPSQGRSRRKPGRKSSFHLVEAQAQKWREEKHDFASVAELCRKLAKWLADEHPGSAMTEGSISNGFYRDESRRDLLSALCPNVPAVSQPHGYARRSRVQAG